MRRIAIAAAKGGTGKTTTAVTLAHGLALAGERVLLVDCDPNRDAARHFGLPQSAGVAAWLTGGDAPAVLVRPGLRVVDSGGDALTDLEPLLTRPGAERRLRAALDALEDTDWVIVDCPPGHGALPRLALAACDEVLMPVAADYLSLASVAAARRHFARGGAPGSDGLRLLGILPTFCDPRAAIASEVDAVLFELLSEHLLQTRITVSDALRAAPARRGTIFDSEPLSLAALEYAGLIDEVRAGPASLSMPEDAAVTADDGGAPFEPRDHDQGAEQSVVSRPDARLD